MSFLDKNYMLEYIYNEVNEVSKKKNKNNKNSKSKKKEIPVQNYVVLGIIMIVTLLVVLYSCSWYKQYNDSKINEPVITSVLREVEYNNLDTVLRERDVLIMYMCTTNESICRSFEKKFSEYVKDQNLVDEIIYLNLGYSSDENDLLDTVYNKYKCDNLVKKVYEYPTLLIFNQGEIVDVLSSDSKDKISIKQVKEFLESYEL